VGTLLAHSYKNPNTFIGAIFGTGTNGAYVEDTKNIKTLTDSKEQEMIVNIEWGNFDKEKTVLPVTIHDNKLDRESIVRGIRTLEMSFLSGLCGCVGYLLIRHLFRRILESMCLKR